MGAYAKNTTIPSAEGYVIQTDDDKCVGCNRCIRVCPIETANIAYQDGEGNIKVRLDPSQCILCGACVGVCDHGTRHIDDDTARFFADLKKGGEIAVMAAPSIQTVIPQWRRLFSWLRGLGVRVIYDVSLGADICIWAHLRLMEREPRPIITQPCPVVVSYCERHRHDLLPFLSPVHSPMACTAVYMRHEGVGGKLASISPCIAKTKEHQSTGLIDYNITFQRLYDYLEEQGIVLPEEESGFDHPEAGPGALFPLPGGLRENLALLAELDLHVEKAEGSAVFAYLDQYAETEADCRPDVFDVLGCADGCLIGSATVKEQNIFKLNKCMQQVRLHASEHMEDSRKRLMDYDRYLKLEDYLRGYHESPKKYPDVSDGEIDQAFNQMRKDDFPKRHFNCGACGSDSCYNMARKVALKVNIPTNCVILSRDEVKEERERNAEYLALVQSIGDNLFSTRDEEYAEQVNASLRVISETIHCSAVVIWRRVGDGESLACERLSGWYGTPETIALLKPWPEEWLLELKAGRRVLVNPREDRPNLFPEAVSTVFMVPIRLRGEFWGFVDVISMEEREFQEEEASLLEAAGILLMSGILEREVNRSLIAAREDALAGTRAKSDFLSRMSHEIRTPMNAIIGMTHMGTHAQDLDRKDYCLEKISNASSHLLGIINDILDMSKIEADKFDLSYVWFRFEKMLQNVANVVAFRMEEKGQIFTVHLDHRLPEMVEGDDQRLAQVITNLLSNAIKFTPEGGRIRLIASLVRQVESTYTIRIEVSDTGIGIEKEATGRLFQSFEQAESGTSRKFGGTGLGLAISKRIVELMGGDIWVESVPGEGSSFIVTVQVNGKQSVGEQLLAFLGAPKLLAVDDDPDTCAFFEEVSKQFGLSCDTALSGEAALELVEQSGGYDICFIDYNLTDTNGVLLSRQIRQRQKRRPDIVMISGMDRSEIEKHCKKDDIAQILAKPLFPSSVLDCINESRGLVKSVENAAKRNQDEGCFEGQRILLAEDVEINREIFMALLEPTLLEVDYAENGRIAVEKFKAAPDRYRLILMDVQMPEMDGYEATGRIRALDLPKAGEIPIIAMTANVFREDIEHCLASGMNDHVGKPIDYDALVEKLRQYLPAQALPTNR